jgi:hypothetical protein
MATLSGTASFDLNGWYIENNVWDTSIAGLGYTVTGTYNPSNLTSALTYSWNFGALPADGYYWVHAFPDIGFGQDAWTKTTTAYAKPFPLSIANLSTYKVNYDVNFGGTTDGYNVAFEMYLTSSAQGGANTITNEVMVWIHTGGWKPAGSPVGSFSDSNYSGQIYSYPVYESGLHFNYTAVLANSDDPSGTIDLKAIMQKLEALGIIKGSEYISNIQLGAEIAAGKGSLTINKLQLDVQDGGAEELIDGSGTTTVTSTPAAGSGSSSTGSSTSGTPVSGFAQGVLFSDFNGDSNSDVVFSNGAGQALIWSMKGGTKLSASAVIGSAKSGTTIIGAADFNGDHKPDLLVQDASGQAYVWTMNGLTRQAATAVGTNPGSAWDIIGSGDFNGDGKADILWQNTNTEQAMIWLVNGTTVSQNVTLASPGTNWHVIGSGDFDASGRSDIAWQNSATGQIQLWLMNGTTVQSKTTLTTNPGSAWHLIGTGDVNGDNRSDLILQNTNGQVQVWEMNGTTITAKATVGNPGSGWQAIGSGDYNDDGKDDILFQNTSGQLMVWAMNGLTLQSQMTGTNPGSTWHAAVS